MPLLSDLFSLTRVINLPDRKDRLREITEQLNLLGMPFAAGSVELYVASRPTELAGFDSLGTRGCYLSHLDILRDARDRHVESVLVMEDDCEINPSHIAKIGEVAATLAGRPWAFCYLGHIVPMPAGVEPGLIPYAGPVQTAHLYAVHHSVLGPLVDYLEACLTRPGGDPVGGPMPVDGAITMFRAANPNFVTLMAQPVLATQRSSRSSITYRSYEMIPGIKQAMGLARAMRRKLKAAS